MLSHLQNWLPRRWRSAPPIADRLWRQTFSALPFLSGLGRAEQNRLRELCGHFLLEKRFHGAHGLPITDHMALGIAAQACLPLLHMRLPDGRRPQQAAQLLEWFDDFVGIVVQPGAALAPREVTDQAGVVHRYREALAGEAMERGPVMLSWEEVARADELAVEGRNVVIHEFAHKFDMHGMQPGHPVDGAPLLPPGFCGQPDATTASAHWRAVMQSAYERFRESVSMAERFGGAWPWLDSYAATAPAEFFAVCCEAYFVARDRFALELPELMPLFDGLFRAAEQD